MKLILLWNELGKNVSVIGFNTYGEQGYTSGGSIVDIIIKHINISNR